MHLTILGRSGLNISFSPTGNFVCSMDCRVKFVAIAVQEGIDPSFEVIFVGSLPVDVPPETQDVRSASLLLPYVYWHGYGADIAM